MDPSSKRKLERINEELRGVVRQVVPAHPSGAVRGASGAIRPKNLLVEAGGLRPTGADGISKPVWGLLEDWALRRHQTDELVLLLSAGTFGCYRLSIPFGEVAVVTNHYYLKHSLPLLAAREKPGITAMHENAAFVTQRKVEGRMLVVHARKTRGSHRRNPMGSAPRGCLAVPGVVLRSRGSARRSRWDRPPGRLEHLDSVE